MVLQEAIDVVGHDVPMPLTIRQNPLSTLLALP